MYTRRNYSILAMLNWTRRYILVIFLLSLAPVCLYTFLGWKWLHLPWRPIGLVGTALAFIIGFKNNASYGRLWEARKVYGGIVNASRLFATMLNDFITNEFTDEPRSKEELFRIRKELVLRHVAWMTSLRHALRVKRPWESTGFNKSDREYMSRIRIMEYEVPLEKELEGYISVEEKHQVLGMTNKQAACLNLQSRQIGELKAAGLIDDFRHMEFKNLIQELFTLQGKAERIKNFPYPRQFATLNLFFVWIFMILLPFGLVHEFDAIGASLVKGTADVGTVYDLIASNFVWLSIPFSVVISWIFLAMERVGDVSENPFEGVANDVPITTMSRAIEIDMREMIGDEGSQIPEPHAPMLDIQM